MIMPPGWSGLTFVGRSSARIKGTASPVVVTAGWRVPWT